MGCQNFLGRKNSRIVILELVGQLPFQRNSSNHPKEQKLKIQNSFPILQVTKSNTTPQSLLEEKVIIFKEKEVNKN